MSVDLRVDWCSYEAAKYAVEHWHYSRAMPRSKLAKMGVWEDDRFIGAVIYSWGANNNIGKPYGLKQVEVCELVRVALTAHVSPVSQVVAATVKMLREQSSGLRLIVSYADPRQGHNGAIYQAMNWLCVGTSNPQAAVFVDGAYVHKKSMHGRIGSLHGVTWSPVSFKHKYLYPLDRAMRKQIAPLAKPYPKREMCGPSVEGDTLPQAESQVRSLGAASVLIAD